MTGTRSKVVIAGVVALALTACSTSASTTQTAATQAAGSPSAAAGSPSASPSVLKCGTDVDTNNAGNELTATDVIANLDAVADHDLIALDEGNLGIHAFSVLVEASDDLGGYAGSKLSDDAQAFSNDENSYMPDNNQANINTSDVLPMLKDIVKLTADCRASFKISQGLSG